MSQKKTTTKGGTKGKAEGSETKATTEETAARIRALLSDPATPARVIKRVARLCEVLSVEGVNSILEPTPALLAETYRQAAPYATEGKALAARRELDALAERREPKDAKLARRVSELINSGVDGSVEVSEWFMQLTNDVGVSLENEDFCAAAFVKAARLVEATKPVRRITTKSVMLYGAQKAYEQLKEIVRRVDAGETLAQIRAERQAAISTGEKTGRAPSRKAKKAA